MVLHNVARILELAVPLMDHPGESFLAQLEEDMMKLVLNTACWYVTDSQPLLGLSWSQHQVHVYYLCCLW